MRPVRAERPYYIFSGFICCQLCNLVVGESLFHELTVAYASVAYLVKLFAARMVVRGSTPMWIGICLLEELPSKTLRVEIQYTDCLV